MRLQAVCVLGAVLTSQVALAQTEPVTEPSDPASQPVDPTVDSAPADLGPGEPGPGATGGDPVDAIDKVTLEAPASRWSSWEIQGRLLDDLETMGGFIEPVMNEHRAWTKDDRQAVTEFLIRIGYHALIKTEPDPEGGVKVILVLEPITRIRWVEVDISAPTYLDRFHDPIFADSLQRRMTLRPGSPLEFDTSSRTKQLKTEADRLAQYLRNEGFYDAVVTMKPQAYGAHTVKLLVSVSLGVAYRVGEITVAGNTAIASSAIKAHFRKPWRCLIRLCFGERRFRREDLNSNVDELVSKYQRAGFPAVRISTDFNVGYSFNRDTKRVDFHVEVRERRKIDVRFEGSRYSDSKLREYLTLNDEGSYDDVEVEASAEAIRRFYQSKGYFEAIVTWERSRFGVFERIIYAIAEGPRLEVSRIDFQGNKTLSNDQLQDEIVTKRFKRVIIGAGGGFATSLQLEQDARRIQRLYRSRGYREATVDLRVARSRELLDSAAAQAAAVAADLPAESLFVRFDVTEGPLHTVEKVRLIFRSPSKIPEETLRSPLKQRSGVPFIDEHIKADSEALRRQYYRAGFPRATVESKMEPGSSPSKIVVTHEVTPNSSAVIGNIVLRGNFKTRDWILYDELGLRPGQPLTITAAESAQANLRSSGLFSSVQIDYIGLEDPREPTVNVLVRLEERHDNLAELEFGTGYSTDEKFFVETGLVSSNISGTGTRLELRGLLGQKEKGVESTLAFPRWLNRRAFGISFLLELNAFARQKDHERFGSLTTLGTSIAATKTYRRGALDGLLIQLRYDFTQFFRPVELVRPAGNSDDIDTTQVINRSSTLGPVVAYDRRRDYAGNINPLLPSRGFRLEARAEYGEDFVLGTSRFIKAGTSGQHFLPLGRRFRISNALRYDQGFPLGGDVALPEIERYFAGGDTTVRGFEQDRLSTEIIEEQLAPGGGITQFRILPAGGNIRFIHNLDFQMEVWKVIGLPVASAVFADSGVVTNSWEGFELEDLRHSIGIALARINAPFGSFSIEYAMPLDPQLGDDPRGRAHVNFGFLF